MFKEARLKAIEEAKNKESEESKKKKASNPAKKKKEDILVNEKIFVKIPHKVEYLSLINLFNSLNS